MSDFTTTPNYALYKPTVNADVDVWGNHLNANADTLDALLRTIELRSSGGVLLVTDYLNPGQPDGVADNTGGIQNALDDAAGVGAGDRSLAPGYLSLMFPAAAAPYMVNGLIVPANSHLIIEQGATIKHNANQDGYLLGIAQPLPQVAVAATGNTYNSTTGIVTITTTAAHGVPVGGSFVFWGLASLCKAYTATPGTAGTTLNFYAATGLGTLTITNGWVYPSTENVLIELYGTLDGNRSGAGTLPPGSARGGIGSLGHGPNNNIFVRGDNQGFITNTLNWPINISCCTNGEISGITVDNAGQSAAAGSCEWNGHTDNIGYMAVVSGSYVSDTGVMTLTTAGPHLLTTGSLFTITGIGLTALIGHMPQYNAIAGTTGTTLVFNVGMGLATAFNYAAGQIHALSGTYNLNTGASTITTIYPHGLVPGNVFTLANAANPWFAHCGQFTATAGTTGTTINYIDPILGKTPATFNTGVLGILTPSVNVGYVDCVVRHINDLCLIFYGGVRNGYIRNCDVSQGKVNGNPGSCMIFADTNNRGPNYDCEIVGCNGGVYVGSNIFGVNHFNTTITGCHITGCDGAGAVLLGADGLLFQGNFVHDNTYIAAAGALRGDVLLGTGSIRVKISNNVIHNPQVGCTDGNGYGIVVGGDYVEISNNRIGDYQPTKSMTAALTGTWGRNGLSHGNYYGPRIASNDLFPADQSFYATGSVQGISFDAVTNYACGKIATTSLNPFVPGTQPAVPIAGAAPGFGFTVGWNDQLAPGTNRTGLGEIDFYLGSGLGSRGGFNFFHVAAASVVSGTYTAGAVVLTMNMPHTLMPGNSFRLFGVGGTGAGSGTDWLTLTNVWTATAGTNGAIVASAGNTYTSGTGVVTLTTTTAHGITAGSMFVLIGVTGTATTGFSVTNLNGTWTATSVTSTTIIFTALSGLSTLTITGGQVSGTTLAFTAPSGLDILTITGGNLYVGGGDGALGSVDVTRGLRGSLLANDGYGNLRLSGALVHGALYSQSLANAGTVTVPGNTSFVTIRNGASIATGTVVLPDPTGSSFGFPGTSGFNELEINFQNPVGTLTVTAPGTTTVMGSASITTAVATAGNSINFIQNNGTNWLRRIMA